MPNDELAGALQECSLHALLILISQALARSGYGDVQIQGRRHPRQKSRNGGHEIACVSYLGHSPLKVVVKLVDQPLRTRNYDDIAGTMARNRADLGILITTKKISRKIAANQGRMLPVRIEAMDGEALASLIRCSGTGVRPDGGPDYAYLAELEEASGRMRSFARKEGL